MVASRQAAGALESGRHLVSVELSIVIPLHNEEPNVAPLHAELTRVLASMGVAYEIILIDDGSTDGTFAALRRIQAADRARARRPLHAELRPDRGVCRRVRLRARAAHRHLRRRPAERPGRHPAPARRWPRTHDIVCGWRKDRKDDFLTRHVPSVVANWLIGLVTGVRLHDNGCSLKVFRAEVVKPLKLTPGMHRYLPALASQLGGRVTEVVVNHRPATVRPLEVRVCRARSGSSPISCTCVA